MVNQEVEPRLFSRTAQHGTHEPGRHCRVLGVPQEREEQYGRKGCIYTLPTRVVWWVSFFPPPYLPWYHAPRYPLHTGIYTTMGGRTALCASYPPPMGRKTALCASYPPTHHGREDSTMRITPYPPWEGGQHYAQHASLTPRGDGTTLRRRYHTPREDGTTLRRRVHTPREKGEYSAQHASHPREKGEYSAQHASHPWEKGEYSAQHASLSPIEGREYSAQHASL